MFMSNLSLIKYIIYFIKINFFKKFEFSFQNFFLAKQFWELIYLFLNQFLLVYYPKSHNLVDIYKYFYTKN